MAARLVYISPQGQYVMCWNSDIILHQVYAWEIKEGKLHFLCKIPKKLEGKNIGLKNVRNLSANNAQLLEQLQRMQ